MEVDGPRDIEVFDAPGPHGRARLVIPLDPEVARSLTPREGEVLGARIRGRHVELGRRRAGKRKVTDR